MNTFEMLENFKGFFVELNNEKYCESLECIQVSYDLLHELDAGEILESDLFSGDVDKFYTITGIFSAWLVDNINKSHADFSLAHCSILAVGLNY